MTIIKKLISFLREENKDNGKSKSEIKKEKNEIKKEKKQKKIDEKLPKQKQKISSYDTDKKIFAKEYYDNLEIMKRTGFLEEAKRKGLISVESKSSNTFIILVIVIFVSLLAIGILGYGIFGDKFKSDINQNVNITTTPSDINNQYSFNTTTANEVYNNYTIVVNNYLNSNSTCPVV